jgi:hypothetical protein
VTPLARSIRWFRRRRMRAFERTFQPNPGTLVLDAGGTSLNWEFVSSRPRLVVLNLPRTREETDRGVALVFADGRAMPFRDGTFDVVFSNSVIEHLGDGESQRSFAAEVSRVGRALWVQTPNRWFPVEPHLLTPFLHWLPESWQRTVARRFTVWEWIARPRRDQREWYVRHCVEEVRLLGARELARLFPGSAIRRERFLGWTKSIIAVRSARR